MVVIARSAGSSSAVQEEARSISESIDPKLFPEIHPLRQLYDEIAKQIEEIAAVVSLMGIIAVLLAGVGIIGLVGFSVSQRRKEIAIRLALSSPKAHLCGVLLKQFAWPIMRGIVVGSLLAMTGSKFLRIALFGVSNLDPVGFIAGVGVLLVVVVLSAILPARRAIHLNVARALHYE
jgi:ABC-type antimicrobial peptide transport system permease subunit